MINQHENANKLKQECSQPHIISIILHKSNIPEMQIITVATFAEEIAPRTVSEKHCYPKISRSM